ncbi:efflux transporter periplasmic adaptor subunit [Magnetovibrio blakemorei]|uniref:Efflux transporter periplasmic adaptor subunit n=1 Tax=Magnetovibrio blakemorei TaxID=28181 RepID=A0A1E5Q9Z0_9PROT|nr:efflux transporter periplasmic adaptor subunit [Magnetovibrio blakemorei]
MVLAVTQVAWVGGVVGSVSASAQDATFQVSQGQVEDRKSVFATVESVDVVAARARIGGTVTELLVDEGSSVQANQKIARVVDEKLALQLKSIDAQIESYRSQKDLTTTALARAEQLYASGTIPKARLDEARTNREVADRSLASAQAERQVLIQTSVEGDVLSPASGRILKVQVRKGSVILPGEPIASLAAEAYILRLQLPERHAMFISEGDEVQVAQRGLGALTSDSGDKLRSGLIRQVYPEIKQGRVSADVEVAGLGDFFVGERIRVWIGTGARPAIVVPTDFLYSRYNLTFAKLSDGREVVVQPGLPQSGGVEVLSGLVPGDVLAHP